eukprot:11655809-Ditylum_brightwellii.AAC.1
MEGKTRRSMKVCLDEQQQSLRSAIVRIGKPQQLLGNAATVDKSNMRKRVSLARSSSERWSEFSFRSDDWDPSL